MKSKGQSTLEYAILIIAITGALLTMQNYAKRAVQGKLRGTITKLNEGPAYVYDRLKLYPHLLIGKTGISKEDADVTFGKLKGINFAYSPKETEGSSQTNTELKEIASSLDGTVITKNETNKMMQKTERLLPYDR